MLEVSILTLLLLLGSIVLLTLGARRRRVGNAAAVRLPPGPPPEPILGNVRHMKTSHAWNWYHSLQKIYGDIIHVSAMGQPIVVLNSFEAVRSVIGANSSVFLNRPPLTMAGELVGWYKGFSLAPYGPKLHAIRKSSHVFLAKGVISASGPLIEKQVRLAITKLEEDSRESYRDQIRNMVARILLGLIYGLEGEDCTDEFVANAGRLAEDFGNMTKPGAFLVDAFPALRHVPKWFPLAGFHKQATVWKDAATKILKGPFERAKHQIASGKFKPSIASHAFQAGLIDEEELMWTLGNMYTAGTTTMTSTILTFILAMTLHPDVQQKAQEELGSVLGEGPPSLEDRTSLPYIESILKEVLRWHPAAPMAVPYLASKDVPYKDSVIPKGAIVFSNAWAITRDKARYEYPEKFRPERFNDVIDAPLDPRQYVFGVGRRSCPGQHAGDQIVWTVIASLLAAKTISMRTDCDGNHIQPSVEFTGGPISFPEDFECKISSRNVVATV